MPLDNAPEGKRKFAVVGSRPLRPDGVDKVTGRARFGADAVAPGMLVGRILRSPHAHARIKNIDTSKAEKLADEKIGDTDTYHYKVTLDPVTLINAMADLAKSIAFSWPEFGGAKYRHRYEPSTITDQWTDIHGLPEPFGPWQDLARSRSRESAGTSGV